MPSSKKASRKCYTLYITLRDDTEDNRQAVDKMVNFVVQHLTDALKPQAVVSMVEEVGLHSL